MKFNKSISVMVLAIALILPFFLLSTTEKVEQTPREINVTIKDFLFDPDSIQVTTGETVVFKITNMDAVPHTFTSNDTNFDFDTGNITAGSTMELEFTAPSLAQTIDFTCTVHPTMMGEIVVTSVSFSGSTNTESTGTGSEPQNAVTTSSIDILIIISSIMAIGVTTFAQRKKK